MAIQFLQVDDLWGKYGLASQDFNALTRREKNLTIMRAQLYSNLFFNNHQGPSIIPTLHKEHDQKCMETLLLAKRLHSDLLLYPEYCISYELLEKIVQRRDLWPDTENSGVCPVTYDDIPRKGLKRTAP